MKNKLRKIIGIFCAVVMCLCVMTGCNGDSKKENEKNEVAMIIGGHEIYEDELMLYCILELLSGKQTYQEVQQDEAKFKEVVINNIIETKMLNDAAEEEKMEFNDEDTATRDELIDYFTGYVSDEVFKKYGISDDLVEEVFQETSVRDKFANDKKNEIGQSLNDKYVEEYKDYNFQKLYYILFPIVEADENGEPSVDEDGNYVMLDKETMAEQKKRQKQQ